MSSIGGITQQNRLPGFEHHYTVYYCWEIPFTPILFIYLFLMNYLFNSIIWLHQVLAVACGDLVP